MSWGRDSKYSSDRGTGISAAEEECWAQHLFSWKTAVTKNSMTVIATAFPDTKFCSIMPFPPYLHKPKDGIKTWARTLLKLYKRYRWSTNRQTCLADKCERALLGLYATRALLPSHNGYYKVFVARRGAAPCTMTWWQLSLIVSYILILKSKVSLEKLCVEKEIVVTVWLLGIEESWAEAYASIYVTAITFFIIQAFLQPVLLTWNI